VSQLIISVSGLRGIVGQTLTPEVAARYAAAYADFAPAGPIVVARDGRANGGWLLDVVAGTLAAAGRDVLDAGVAATPTVGVLVGAHQAAGAVQVSASHNPAPYNGLKLFSPAGQVLDAAAGAEVLERYHQGRATWAASEQVGTRQTIDDAHAAHLARVLAAVDVEAIRQRRFRVVLDANHGSGGLLGRRLLEALGCEATILGEQPTGHFIHEPEPTEENLRDVTRQITDLGAAVGFCQDPDADRLALIDERGRYIGEEATLALCVEHVLGQKVGPIVTNCSTSRMSQDLAERAGAAFYRSRVGEANVVALMQAQKAILGGEGNGGVIDPRVVYVRDSFIGMALVLEALAARNEPLSALANRLPQYHIVKTKITVPAERVAAALDALEAHFSKPHGERPAAQCDRLDGLRLDWPSGWLLVRASNTEPIVRAIAEASTAEEAQAWCEEAAQVIEAMP